jgi:hypothetical protein
MLPQFFVFADTSIEIIVQANSMSTFQNFRFIQNIEAFMPFHPQLRSSIFVGESCSTSHWYFTQWGGWSGAGIGLSNIRVPRGAGEMLNPPSPTPLAAFERAPERSTLDQVGG